MKDRVKIPPGSTEKLSSSIAFRKRVTMWVVSDIAESDLPRSSRLRLSSSPRVGISARLSSSLEAVFCRKFPGLILSEGNNSVKALLNPRCMLLYTAVLRRNSRVAQNGSCLTDLEPSDRFENPGLAPRRPSRKSSQVNLEGIASGGIIAVKENTE